jgi:CRISPR-associated protein Csd1
MLLKHLYDFAVSRQLSDAFKPETQVRWVIELDAEGNLVGTGPRETQGAELNKGKEFDVPKTSRATGSGQVADFLVDDIGAIFGLNSKPTDELKPRAVTNLKAKHDDFWRQIKEAEAATGNPAFKAILRFHKKLAGGTPSFLRLDSTTSPKWMVRHISGGEARLGNDLFTFSVGDILICDDAVKEYWRQLHANEVAETEKTAQVGVCLITGQTSAPIARTHTIFGGMVTGLPKPAKGTGAGIVGADKPAFWSYGLQKAAPDDKDDEAENQRDKNPGYLSPCSIRASKGYLLALQHLSSREDHWLRLGPAWLCFWAAKTETASSLFARLLNKPDTLTVRRFMTSPWAGIEKPPADTEEFFAATLTAAGPRIVVKDWMQATLAEAANHFHQWFADLELFVPPRPPTKTKPAGEEREFHPLSVYWLARTTVREAKDLAPEIPAQLYRAALRGTAPSLSLVRPILDQLQSRLVRDEGYKKFELPYDESRFALLRLIINRHHRTRKETHMEIPPQLTTETDDPAYNCGRLLAILAATQDKAHEYKLEGAGVAERYFGTASVSPASVFPLLCRLNRHHLNKIAKSERFGGHERFIEDQIQGVCALFKPAKPGLPPMFPRTLDLQAQGRFALGFYQQMAADTAARRPGNKKDNNSNSESETK